LAVARAPAAPRERATPVPRRDPAAAPMMRLSLH
jgi:hypothetical protein